MDIDGRGGRSGSVDTPVRFRSSACLSPDLARARSLPRRGLRPHECLVGRAFSVGLMGASRSSPRGSFPSRRSSSSHGLCGPNSRSLLLRRRRALTRRNSRLAMGNSRLSGLVLCGSRSVVIDLEFIERSLMRDKCAVICESFNRDLCHKLREEAVSLPPDRWKRAGVGSGEARVAQEIRGDEISWLDFSSEPQRSLSEVLSEIQAHLNHHLFLGLWDWEAHFARYPVGASYRRHLDRFQDDDRRSLSFVLYLNDSWSQSDGGKLVLQGREPVEVLPIAGTLVLFWSDEVPHEVEAARRERLSIAGWFRRRAL